MRSLFIDLIILFFDLSEILNTENQYAYVSYELDNLEKTIMKRILLFCCFAEICFLQEDYSKSKMKRVCHLVLCKDVVPLESIQDCHDSNDDQVEYSVQIHVSWYFLQLFYPNLLFLLFQDNHVVYCDPIKFKADFCYILNTKMWRIKMNTELATKPLDRAIDSFKGP